MPAEFVAELTFRANGRLVNCWQAWASKVAQRRRAVTVNVPCLCERYREITGRGDGACPEFGEKIAPRGLYLLKREDLAMQKSCRYEEATAAKYPEPVAIAIAKDPQGKYNPITLGWIMFTSQEPPMMAISIGRTRYSLEAIRQAGEFVISFPSSAMATEAVLFGTRSGRDLDKLAESGVKTQPAAKIDGVLLADAAANFECKLVSELDTGDHVLFVGQVVAAHVNRRRSVPRLYSLGDDRLGGVVPA